MKIEKQLGRHLIRAYELPTDTARIDTTTVNVYHRPEQESILDYGVSKDHRPHLRQFKEVLSTLDPVGIPLCSATVAGHCADDRLYVPIWQRMVEVIGRVDFQVVGDCKLASLANRAQIQEGGGYYMAPLAKTGDAPEQLRQWVLHPPVAPVDLYLPGVEERIGQGFEVVVAGNPKRAAPNPAAERLLQAFDNITLYSVTDDRQTTLPSHTAFGLAAPHSGIAQHPGNRLHFAGSVAISQLTVKNERNYRYESRQDVSNRNGGPSGPPFLLLKLLLNPTAAPVPSLPRSAPGLSIARAARPAQS